MPGPKPGALPAWRPPSAFGFNGPAPAFSPSHFRETLKLTTGETPFGRSAGNRATIFSDRTAAIPHRINVAASLPVHFDFSSLRAGIAMLLMRFFAVNAQLRAAYAQPAMKCPFTRCGGHPCPRKRETHGEFHIQ